MDDLKRIQEEATRRGVRRLCHFTQSRKLAHILSSSNGIMSTSMLRAVAPDLLDSNDPHRIDGCLDHVCCSVEYPNSWYLDKVRDRDPLFKEWVIILISPDLLWRERTLYCPRNAASQCGSLIRGGYEGFRALYSERISGAYRRVYCRASNMLDCCPTDGQAEVLVYRNVPRDKILGVAVTTEEQARLEAKRLRLIPDAIPVKWVVAPALYDGSWRIHAEQGSRPPEFEVGNSYD